VQIVCKARQATYVARSAVGNWDRGCCERRVGSQMETMRNEIRQEMYGEQI